MTTVKSYSHYFIFAALFFLVMPSQLRAKKRFTLKVRTTLTLKHQWKKPTFAPESYGDLMDRGQLFHLGRGLWFEQGAFYFLKTGDLKKIMVQAPVQKFLLSEKVLFPAAGQGVKLPEYSVQRLLFYDSKDQVAGIHLGDKYIYSNGGRQFYLHWDLKHKKITHAVLLATKTPLDSWVSIKRIGYDPASKELYIMMVSKQKQTSLKQYTVKILALKGGKKRLLYSFNTSGRFSMNPSFDAGNRQALLVEYAERGHKPAPMAHLVHFDRKRQISFHIPVVTYGVAFSADGKHIYAYSAQSGQVWTIDAKTGKRLSSRRLGSLGHAAGLVFPGIVLVVRNKGFHFLGTKNLKELQYVPITQFHKGFNHTQGTIVGPGRIYLRTSDLLRVIDITKTP
ncbi:hypothetical protein KKF84_08970 [Myxococcota bacterium]|nr:hypothetical protein [Myxococcota bacterium]